MNKKKLVLKIVHVIISMTIKIEDFDFDNILLDEKSCQNILVYINLYKTLIGTKSLRVWFSIVERFIRVYDETIYLVLFAPEKYDSIYNRIIYLISQKSGITYVFLIIMQKIEIDSYDSLLQAKTLICIML